MKKIDLTLFFVLLCTFASIRTVASQATECERDRGQHCHKWAQCERRQGDQKPRCYCSPGFQGDGRNCHRILDNREVCRPPNQIQQGSFSPRRGSYSVGNVITYQCNHDHTLLGNSQRTCQQGGQWSGSEPRCNRPDECQKRNYQTCHMHADCVRINDKKHECKCRDGFKGDGVHCEGKGCQRPPDLTNGKLLTQQQNFVRGNVVTFKCDRGYKLMGNSQRTCRNDGRWSGNEPRCEKLQDQPVKKPCRYPPGIPNGNTRVSDGSLRPGTIITYSCRRPYRIEGNSQRTCQDDGTWSGEDPRCQKARRQQLRRCQRPQDIPNGYFSTSDTSYKPRTVVLYQCRQPYRLVGPNERRCLPNGQWHGPIPRCEDPENRAQKRCERPPDNIAHGNIKISDQRLVVGTVVTFTCNRGYRLEGDTQRTCQGDGRWSGRQPNCRKK